MTRHQFVNLNAATRCPHDLTRRGAWINGTSRPHVAEQKNRQGITYVG